MEDTACKKGGMEEKPSEITISLSKGNRKKANGEENPTIESTKKTLSICLPCRYMRNPRRRI